MAGTSALLFPAFHPLDSACHFREQPLLPVSSQWIISANYSQETPLQRHLAWGKPGRASAASLTALQVEQKFQLCPGFRSLRCSSLQVRWGEGTHPAAATGGGLMDSRVPDPPPRPAGGEGRAGLLHGQGLQYSVTDLHEPRGVTRPSVQPRRPHAQAP